MTKARIAVALVLLAFLLAGLTYFLLVDRDPNHHAIVRYMEKFRAENSRLGLDLYIQGWGESRAIANPRSSYYGCTMIEAEVGIPMGIKDRLRTRLRTRLCGGGGGTWYFAMRDGEVLHAIPTDNCFYGFEAEFEEDAKPEEEESLEIMPVDVAPVLEAIVEDAATPPRARP
jgi:hypothetical protein